MKTSTQKFLRDWKEVEKVLNRFKTFGSTRWKSSENVPHSKCDYTDCFKTISLKRIKLIDFIFHDLKPLDKQTERKINNYGSFCTTKEMRDRMKDNPQTWRGYWPIIHDLKGCRILWKIKFAIGRGERNREMNRNLLKKK